MLFRICLACSLSLLCLSTAEDDRTYKLMDPRTSLKHGIPIWDGRIVVVPKMKKPVLKERKYNICLTSTYEMGYCTRLSECKGFSITTLHNNICFQERYVPGVCCPQRLTRPTTTTTTTSSPVTLGSDLIENTIDRLTTSDDKNKTSTTTKQECGLNSRRSPSESPSSRIVNGNRSVEGHWPWMAALFANTFMGRKFHCGGSLISDRHILTGAHCVKDQYGITFGPGQITVRLGDHDISTLRNYGDPGRFYRVLEIRAHPKFKNINHYFMNDVAVLKLTTKVMISNTMFPVCLPSPEIQNAPLDSFAGQYAMVTGFGRTMLGKPSKRLMEAAVPIWNNRACDEAYYAPITDIFICAGYVAGGIDACQGDSGGPLQIEIGNQWTQIGITSFGKGCGEPRFPGVYTRVSKFTSWINKNML